MAKYQIVAGRAPIFEKAVDIMDPSKNIRCICKVQSSPVIETRKKKKKGPIKKYYFSIMAITWMEWFLNKDVGSFNTEMQQFG